MVAIISQNSMNSIVIQAEYTPIDSMNLALLTNAKFLTLTVCQMGFLFHAISARNGQTWHGRIIFLLFLDGSLGPIWGKVYPKDTDQWPVER